MDFCKLTEALTVGNLAFMERTSDKDSMNGSALTEAVFRELAQLWRTDPKCRELIQFRRLATAHQYRRLYELIDAQLTPGCDVLDWGCGNGHVSYSLMRRNFNVSGFSFEDFGLRSHLGHAYQFKQGNEVDPATLPFAAASFDAVMSVGVLEHVRESGGNELASLREIERVLRPGGLFLCYHFPNRYSLIEAITRTVAPRAHAHRYRYTRSDIQALCRDSGLELVTSSRYGALPRNLWYRAPRALGDSALVAGAWDLLDAGLGAVLSPWVQNYLFVARKR
jgi:2-polyprenyl-3-methyl-5-hydroxy-6-metoxy-1,4-benzoquinol methylase